MLDEWLQEIPDLAVRIGEVDVAAPDPFSAVALFRADERGRLRIVDDKNVLHELHTLAVLLVVHQEDIEDLLGGVVIAAMQSVVEPLRDFEKVVAAGDDLPLGLNFQLLHERNEPVEDLCDAAADGGRVHHLHGLAA